MEEAQNQSSGPLFRDLLGASCGITERIRASRVRCAKKVKDFARKALKAFVRLCNVDDRILAWLYSI